jgi:hypothetical protein
VEVLALPQITRAQANQILNAPSSYTKMRAAHNSMSSATLRPNTAALIASTPRS